MQAYPEDLMLVRPIATQPLIAVSPTGEAIGVKSPYASDQAKAQIQAPPGQRLAAAWREFRAALLDERLAPAVGAILPKLPWIWLVGSSLMLIYFSCGLMGADRLRRECDALDQEELGGLLKRLSREMGVQRRVAIGMSDRVAAPLVLGVMRPMILLPMSVVSSLSVDQLEFVLLHELAHVRRHDNFVNLLQRFVEAIAFFHPAAWRISAWVRLERELCCDVAVLKRRASPTKYAETLASLAMPGLSAPYAVASLANHQLVSRVRHIMSVQEPSMRFSSRWFVVTAMALLATGGFVAAFAQTPDKPETKKPDEKAGSGQTFTIEFQVGEEGVIQLQAAPDASYASVAEMLKGVALTLEKQGKHPQIKVKSHGHEESWSHWTVENCQACHTGMPEKEKQAGIAEVRFNLGETCQPGIASWVELAAKPQEATATLALGEVFNELSRANIIVQEQPNPAKVDFVTTALFLATSSPNWAAAQASGAPNTFVMGDEHTAWASKTPDSQGEWLLLTYDAPVDINAVLVHETYNPGAIARVDAILPDNGVVVLWSGEPKAVASDSPRLFFCKPKTTVKAAKIRITIASDVVPGWNEIDAVGILDSEGKVHWASGATASSSFADNSKASVDLQSGAELRSNLLLVQPTVTLDDFKVAPNTAELSKEYLGTATLSANPPEAAAQGVHLQLQAQYKSSDAQPLGLAQKVLGDETVQAKSPTVGSTENVGKGRLGIAWSRAVQPKPSDAEKLKQIEAELDLLQKQLDVLRAKMKP